MTTAVLLSGGLDSAVLVAEEARHGEVQPIYVNVGLAWEAVEHEAARRFLEHSRFHYDVHPLVPLSVDMSDVYAPSHWARQGRPPGYHSADEEVYLPGRNIVLLGKAAVFCAAAGFGRIAIGTLAHNPFPDATPAFRQALAQAMTLGLARDIEIAAPFSTMGKADVIGRGAAAALALELTVSCMQPSGFAGDRPRHCGLCNKCRERHEAFLAAGVEDRTCYDDQQHMRQARR
jgi:7-cyano-7-deazaguanine synthase